MSEQDENTQSELPSEIEILKGRADKLGIKYHPSIGADALRKKIQETNEADSPKTKVELEKPSDSLIKSSSMTTKEMAGIDRENAFREATRLVRVEISCMNPNKREWQGEIFTVSNSKIGTIKKFVPFNVPFHVPQAIFNMIQERQCQIFENKKDDRGNNVRRGKLIKEFAISKLDPLTERELQELAAAQAASGTIGR